MWLIRTKVSNLWSTVPFAPKSGSLQKTEKGFAEKMEEWQIASRKQRKVFTVKGFLQLQGSDIFTIARLSDIKPSARFSP